MAMAAEHGLFESGKIGMAPAKSVLEGNPKFTAAYFGYEPDADGQDTPIDSLPKEAREGGRFLPYYFRELSDDTKIALSLLLALKNSTKAAKESRKIQQKQTRQW